MVIALMIAGSAGEGYARNGWEYYFERGSVQFRGEMYDNAILSLELCLEENPGSFAAANMLAEVYVKMNRREKALDYYRRSLEINDRQADVHNALAELYEYFSDADRAFEHFRRATEIDPEHVRAHCSLVRYYLKRNDRDSAERHFRASRDRALNESGALLKRAADAEEKGDHAGAEKLYRKILEQGPSLVDAYIALYEVYRRMGRYEKAVAVLEKLKFIRPDYEKAYFFLGNIYFTGKFPGKRKLYLDRAVENLKKTVELNPENFDACYTLSTVYRHMGKDIEAKAWEEKGMAIEDRRGGKKSP